MHDTYLLTYLLTHLYTRQTDWSVSHTEVTMNQQPYHHHHHHFTALGLVTDMKWADSQWRSVWLQAVHMPVMSQPSQLSSAYRRQRGLLSSHLHTVIIDKKFDMTSNSLEHVTSQWNTSTLCTTSKMLVSGTVSLIMSRLLCTFCDSKPTCLTFHTLPLCDCTVPAQWHFVTLDTLIVLAYLLTP